MGVSFCSAQPGGNTCECSCTRGGVDENKTLSLNSRALFDVVEDDGDLAGALESALKAVALHKADQLAEAEKHLEDAERKMENSQMMKGRTLLKEALEADPDIMTLRQHVAKMQEVNLAYDSADEETRKLSTSRMSEIMSPEKSKEMAAIPESDGFNEVESSPVEESETVASPLPALQGAASKIEQLCREMRIYEAHQALIDFEVDVASAQKMCLEVGRQDLSNAVAAFSAPFLSAPMAEKVKKVIARLNDARTKMQPPSTDDTRWASIQIKEPSIGDSFCFNLYVRHMEDSERDPKGPSTQVLAVCKVANMAGDLTAAVALQREVDLFCTDWLKQVVQFKGERGTAEKLFSSHAQTILSVPVLGKIEDNVLREFAFSDSQYPTDFTGFNGRGMILLEYGFPSQTEFEGWTRWDCPKGSTPSEGSMNYYFIHPAADDPANKHSLVVCAKVGIGLPKWMLPLAVIKRIAGVMFKENFRNLKQNIFGSTWQNLPYLARIAEEKDFYGPLQELIKEASANPSLFT